MKHDDKELAETKRLMGALVRMPPKPHEEMKVGKSKQPTKTRPRKRKSSNDRD